MGRLEEDATTGIRRASPDRPNVLVTSASRKVLLVRAFREALARIGDGRVVASISTHGRRPCSKPTLGASFRVR
jgi:hypothetical protein